MWASIHDIRSTKIQILKDILQHAVHGESAGELADSADSSDGGSDTDASMASDGEGFGTRSDTAAAEPDDGPSDPETAFEGARGGMTIRHLDLADEDEDDDGEDMMEVPSTLAALG